MRKTEACWKYKAQPPCTLCPQELHAGATRWERTCGPTLVPRPPVPPGTAASHRTTYHLDGSLTHLWTYWGLLGPDKGLRVKIYQKEWLEGWGLFCNLVYVGWHFLSLNYHFLGMVLKKVTGVKRVVLMTPQTTLWPYLSLALSVSQVTCGCQGPISSQFKTPQFLHLQLRSHLQESQDLRHLIKSWEAV